jgi:hypothetical protein
LARLEESDLISEWKTDGTPKGGLVVIPPSPKTSPSLTSEEFKPSPSLAVVEVGGEKGEGDTSDGTIVVDEKVKIKAQKEEEVQAGCCTSCCVM